MKPADPFPRLLHAFFYEWMVQQRNASVHTVRSYRDTWRLFLRFVAQRRRRPVAQLNLADLTAHEVSAFLRYTEQERGDTIGTRNCRLSALRSFFNFVADREPIAVAQCSEILRIPTKRAPIYAACYLEPEEVKAILAQPDRSSIDGQRDHALLSFLYNTGARIQEALDVWPQAIRFESPACVRLYGKGRKERLCPLWLETVSLLRSLLRRQPRADNEPIFAKSLRRPAWRIGCPLQVGGICRGGRQDRAEPGVEARHAAQLQARDGGASGRSGRRHNGDQKLAGACQPRHNQPLCPGQSGDQAASARTP